MVIVNTKEKWEPNSNKGTKMTDSEMFSVQQGDKTHEKVRTDVA